MPLPIAHTFISTSVYAAYRGGISLNRKDMRGIALFVFAGLLPDLDILLVPVAGIGFHRGMSHSLVFVLFAALSIFFVLKLFTGASTRLFFFLLLTLLLHPLCDFFTPDYLETRGGVQLLYPFSHAYYQSPVPLFMGVELRYFHTIFSLHTLAALCYEFVLTSGLLAATLYIKQRGVEEPLPEVAEEGE